MTVLTTDLTETRPLERKADSVILAEFLVEDPSERYVLIVESQTDPDEDKEWSWPYYIAYLRARYRCQVVLLVVCSKVGSAQWARTTITSGLPGLVCMLVQPVVLGPDNVPVITDLEQACSDVGFTVFSALTHSRSGRARGILEVLAEALGTVDVRNAAFLSEFIEAGLAETGSQQIWRSLMLTRSYPHVSQVRALGREEGREEGAIQTRIADILRILDRRGIEVPTAERTAIEGNTDLGTLETWFDRALTASDIKDLFAE